jgi:ketosteroid isomerase-like protein
MMTRRPATACLAALAAAQLVACATPLLTQPEVEPPRTAQLVVDLEGRFAAASRDKGARAAFLEFLAEDAIVLQPGPVWGRAAWEAADELAGTLDWAPDWAELAGDEALGFATGRWLLTPAEGARVEGRYLTVWRKGAGGWAVVFDGGFGRRAAETVTSPAPLARLGVAKCEPGSRTPPGELQLRDLALSGSADKPYGARVSAQLGPMAVLFHPRAVEGHRDRAAQQAALDALAVTTQLWPMGSAVAASGDLGYTYGLSAPAADAKADASYAHIWCRVGGEWTLLLGLRTALPG